MNEVFGLDLEAWKMWVEYRKQIRKPLRVASIQLAQKRLAALGPQQLEAVEYSIANGYQGLFAPKSAKAQVQKMNTDQRKLNELAQRAAKTGFRQPREGEDLIGYRTLLERHENSQWQRNRQQQVSA